MRAAVVPEPSVAPQIMPAPEVIPVRRTEEDAGYVSFRPVVRQNFLLHDLLGLVLSVTGKNRDRVRQIVRSGSVSFHAYHYSWAGFEFDESELISLLARFPDPDPSRAFRVEACNEALLEGGSPPRPLLDLERATVSRKRLLRGRSFWDALLAAAKAGAPAYEGYSYHRRADLYRLDVDAAGAAALSAAARSLAPRDMRGHLRTLASVARIVFVCPREAA